MPNGRAVTITVMAGALDGLKPLAPPPHSWAARPEADVAIWSIALDAGASWTVPPARDASTVRTLHLFRGTALEVGGRVVPGPAAIRCTPIRPTPIRAVDGPVEILLLQGRPIGEPVAQYGPFVMNTRAELEQAFQDYPAHAVRRLAVPRERAGASAHARPLCASRRWTSGGSGRDGRGGPVSRAAFDPVGQALDDNGPSAVEPQRSPEPEGGLYFFVALQAVPVPVVPFIELPLTVPV